MPYKISVFTNKTNVTAEELLSNKLINSFADKRAKVFTYELGKPSNYALGPTRFDLLKGTSFFIAHEDDKVLGGLVLNTKEIDGAENNMQFFANHNQEAIKPIGKLFKDVKSAYIYGVYKDPENKVSGVLGDLYKSLFAYTKEQNIDVIYSMSSNKNVEASLGNKQRYGQGYSTFVSNFNADSIFDNGNRYFRLPFISVSENLTSQIDAMSKSPHFVKSKEFSEYFKDLKQRIASENEGCPDPKSFTLVDMARAHFWAINNQK